VAPPRVVVLDALAAACEPPLGSPELRAWLRAHALAWARAAGGGADPLELTAASEVMGLVGDGPLILVAPDVPALADHHLAAARDDLAAGVLLSSAATGDGTPFLMALSVADPELLAAVGASFNDVLGLAAARGGELGMIRAERRLATLADARALLVDPLTPPALRALLPRAE
jgi:glycosyltransferase A (GT-A) superfamily protein (DUF2064 family)